MPSIEAHRPETLLATSKRHSLKDCQNYLETIVGQKSCLFLEGGHLESNSPSPRNIGNVSLEGNFSNKTRFNHFKVLIRLLTLKIKQVTKFPIL